MTSFDNKDNSVTFVPAKHSSLSFESKIVDDYILGETLGAGSCAIVKLGTHRTTGEHVAVKIVRPSTLQKQKEVLREVEALRTLKNHPHIIKLLKIIKENGYVCLILELGKGGELFNYILDNGRLSEDHARKIFRQVLSGLQYCHAHLIVHRDLKPENIMLDSNGDAKISDFGLSNFVKPHTLFGTFCGSPIYTSPEIVLHRKYNGALADVWSLGVILFVMVSGGMPWRLEQNKVQNLDQLLAGNFKLPDSLGLTEECKHLIRSMITAESTDRASIEAIVNHPWVTKGYNCAPSAQLTRQPVVPLSEINVELVNQLSQLSMDVQQAVVSIQQDPHSPALTAYRFLLNKHARSLRVSENVEVPADLANAPPSPSRIRARSDPSSDKLKTEKSRAQKIKSTELDGASGEGVSGREVKDRYEKERIREKIKKWKNMHKSDQASSKNSAIVNQSDHILLANESIQQQQQQQQHQDKLKREKLNMFKNFITYFKRQPNHTGEAEHNNKQTIIVQQLPLRLHSSPMNTRHSPMSNRQ